MEIWQFRTFVDQEIGNFALGELHRRRNLAFLLIGVIGFSWLAAIYCHLAVPYIILLLMTTIIEYKQNYQTKLNIKTSPASPRGCKSGLDTMFLS